MAKNLYYLTKQAKTDNHSLLKIIDLFSPKIKKSLKQTNYQNREDLEQEIKLKMIANIKEYEVDEIPGFFQMLEQLERKSG